MTMRKDVVDEVVGQLTLADTLLVDLINQLGAHKATPLTLFALASKLAALATYFEDFNVGELLNAVLAAQDDDNVMKPLLEQMTKLNLIMKLSNDSESEGEAPIG